MDNNKSKYLSIQVFRNAILLKLIHNSKLIRKNNAIKTNNSVLIILFNVLRTS